MEVDLNYFAKFMLAMNIYLRVITYIIALFYVLNLYYHDQLRGERTAGPFTQEHCTGVLDTPSKFSCLSANPDISTILLAGSCPLQATV